MYLRFIFSIEGIRLFSLVCLFALLSLFSLDILAANSIDGIRVWPAPENTRIFCISKVYNQPLRVV